MNIYDLDIFRENVEYANQVETSRVIDAKFVQDLTGCTITCEITTSGSNSVAECEYDAKNHVVSYCVPLRVTKEAGVHTGQYIVVEPAGIRKSCSFKLVVNPSVASDQEAYDANEIQIQAMREEINTFKSDTSETVSNMESANSTFKSEMTEANTTFKNNTNADYEAFKEEVRDIAPGLVQSPNENILINSDFKIWRRGARVEITSNGKFHYTADRWCTKTTSTFTKEATGLKTTSSCSLYQFMEFKLKSNTKYAVSASIDGVVKTGWLKTDGTTSTEPFFGYDSTKEESGYSGIYISLGAGQILNWVKLEESDNATDYISKSFAQDEMDCLRYFYHFNGNVRPSLVKGTVVWGSLPLVVDMRIQTPNLSLREGSLNRQDGSTSKLTASEIGTQGINEGGHSLVFNLTVPNVTWNNEPVFVNLSCFIDAEIY